MNFRPLAVDFLAVLGRWFYLGLLGCLRFCENWGFCVQELHTDTSTTYPSAQRCGNGRNTWQKSLTTPENTGKKPGNTGKKREKYQKIPEKNPEKTRNTGKNRKKTVQYRKKIRKTGLWLTFFCYLSQFYALFPQKCSWFAPIPKFVTLFFSLLWHP